MTRAQSSPRRSLGEIHTAAVLVAAVLVLLFRSWLDAAVALVSVGAAVAWTLGLMGWLGWPQNSLTQALPPLVLVIGVCDAMHVLAGYVSRTAARAGGLSPRYSE